MRVVVCCMIVVAFCGCQSLKWKPQIPSAFKPFAGKRGTAPENAQPRVEFGAPQRLAVVWKDSVLQGVGKGPTVGFAGQVYLYDAAHEPVRADGQLVIYGYEEDDQNPSPAADKKFVFPRDQFQSHYQPTALGATYNVWIPWEKVGGARKTVTLIPVFKTADGKIIQGEQSLAVLPGKTPDREMLAKTEIFSVPVRPWNAASHIAAKKSSERPDSVHLAGHQAENDGSTQHQAQIISSSINLPRHLAQRMASLPPTGNRTPAADAMGDLRNGATQAASSLNRSPSDRGARPLGDRLPSNANPSTPAADSESSQNTMPAWRPVFGMPGSFGR